MIKKGRSLCLPYIAATPSFFFLVSTDFCPADLPADRLGKLLDELYHPGIFIRCRLLFYIILDFLFSSSLAV